MRPTNSLVYRSKSFNKSYSWSYFEPYWKKGVNEGK